MPAFPRLPSSSPITRVPLFWQLQVAGWGAFALLLLPIKQLAYGSMAGAFLITAYQLPLSLALTSLLRKFYLKTSPATRPGRQAAGLVLAGCVAAGAADVLISLPINQSLRLSGPADLVAPALYIFRTTLYLGWSLIYFLLKAQVTTRQQAFQLAVTAEQLRLEALRYQFNPQFLTSSLAMISEAIERDPAVARAMAMRLTNFYRSTLHQVGRNEVATLGHELELIRAYLEIERLHRGNALVVQFTVEESLMPLPLPPLLLLPLVKKAVEQGFAAAPERVEISVVAEAFADGEVLLEVSRPGRLGDEEDNADPLSGSDLLNLGTRLEQHYPGCHRFELAQDSVRARATLILPLGVPVPA